MFGDIASNDVAASINYDSLTITIDLRKIHHPEALHEVALHELQHLDQITSGRLKIDSIDGQYIWHDKAADTTEVIDFEDFDYETAPWEIEAESEANRLMELMNLRT